MSSTQEKIVKTLDKQKMLPRTDNNYHTRGTFYESRTDFIFNLQVNQ